MTRDSAALAVAYPAASLVEAVRRWKAARRAVLLDCNGTRSGDFKTLWDELASAEGALYDCDLSASGAD